jgi:hypothetical protein
MKTINLKEFCKCDANDKYNYKHLWRNEGLIITKNGNGHLTHFTEKFKRALHSEFVIIPKQEV